MGKKNNLGFTLIELLIVITIIAVLLVVFVPQFNKYSKSKVLKTTALELQTALRTAQNNAASGIKCGSSPPASWGLQFTNDPDSTSYKVLALNSDGTVNNGCIAKTYLLPADVSIISTNLPDTLGDCFPMRGTVINASFSNVTSDVNISKCEISETVKMVLTLQLKSDTDQTEDVVLEKGGAIYIGS